MSDTLDLAGLWQRVQSLLPQGRLAEAATALRDGLVQFGAATSPALAATHAELLTCLGTVESAQGHWAESRTAFDAALTDLTPPVSETAPLRVMCLQGLGDGAFGQNQFDEADKHYQAALDLYCMLAGVWGWRKVVQAISQRADCALGKGDGPEFLRRLDAAIALAAEHQLADLEQSQRQRRDEFMRGLGATGEVEGEAAPASADAIDAWRAQATRRAAEGDRGGALRILRKILKSPALNTHPRQHFFVLVDLADLCSTEHDFAEGLARAEEALALAEALNTLLGGELTRIALQALVLLLLPSTDPMHRLHADAMLTRLVALGPGVEVVAVLLERARQSLMRSDYPAALADITQAEPLVTTPEMRRVVDMARVATLGKISGGADAALAQVLKALGSGGSFDGDEAALTTWAGQLRALESLQGQAAVLLARAGRAAEAFTFVENGKARRLRAQLAGAGPALLAAPVALDTLRDALRADGAAMALFWVAANETLIVTVDPWAPEPRCAFVPLGSAELRGLIATPDDDATQHDLAWAAKLDRLSERLAPALREVVAHCEAHGKAPLILVPYSDLYAVPFAALRWDKTSHLADHCALAHVPSATIWHWLRARRSELGPRKCLVAGTGETRDAAAGRVYHFAEQARAVARQLGMPSLLVDPSPQLFLQAAREHSVVHLEAHGKYDPKASGVLSSSWLVFPGEARLTAKDIVDGLKGRPTAELVFLSACESGLFSLRQRSEVGGHWDAFLSTGALSVVATLISVDPQAARALPGVFYREWLAGAGKAEALRRAQLEVRASWPRDPQKWASHILIGLHT